MAFRKFLRSRRLRLTDARNSQTRSLEALEARYLLASAPVAAAHGDANLDGLVDAADYTVWADHFGQSGVGVTQGDFTGESQVNAADLDIFLEHFGESVTYPAETYGTVGPVGPLAGAVAPAGAIVFTPEMDDIAQQIAQSPEERTFFFSAGVYEDLSISPKKGQRFLGAQGAILTSTTQPWAFRSQAADVEIRNLTIDGYAPDWPWSAIVTGTRWRVERVEVRNSEMGGVSLYNGSRLTDSYIHHNAQIGVKGEGEGIVLRNTEVAFNNPEGVHDVNDEAGGSKFFDTRGLVVERNNFHHNVGQGIWADYNNSDGRISQNWSHDNTLSGIFWEISHSAVIERNLVENNGTTYNDPGWLQGAGIVVEASDNVTISNNIVRGNANGITAISTARNGGFRLQNLIVQNNRISMSEGRTGIVWDGNPSSKPWDETFWDENEYTLTGLAGFAWEAQNTAVIRSWQQWQAAGNDLNGGLV